MDEEKEMHETEEDTEKKKGKMFGKYGKFFLFAFIVIIQGFAAYAVVKNNYPEIKELASSFSSVGGHYYEISNIVVNPLTSEGKRYLMISLAFEFTHNNSISEAEKKKVEILDRINGLLVRKTAAELADLENRKIIKQELIDEINDLLDKKAVQNLFFTKYVIQ